MSTNYSTFQLQFQKQTTAFSMKLTFPLLPSRSLFSIYFGTSYLLHSSVKCLFKKLINYQKKIFKRPYWPGLGGGRQASNLCFSNIWTALIFGLVPLDKIVTISLFVYYVYYMYYLYHFYYLYYSHHLYHRY